MFFKKNHEEPWQIAAARYCVEHSSGKGFTVDGLKQYIKSKYSVDEQQIDYFFEDEIRTPSGKQYPRKDEDRHWMPPLDLVSKVTDYDELREARKNAKQAFYFSIVAIIISSFALYVTIQFGRNQIEVSQEQIQLQNAIWDYERMRNDRIEARDVQWRQEDLQSQGRLSK